MFVVLVISLVSDQFGGSFTDRCVGDKIGFFPKLDVSIFGASVLYQSQFVRHLLPPGIQFEF